MLKPKTTVVVNTLSDHKNFWGAVALSSGTAAAFIGLKLVTLPALLATSGLWAAFHFGIKGYRRIKQKGGARKNSPLNDISIKATPQSLEDHEGYPHLNKIARRISRRLGLEKTPSLNILHTEDPEKKNGSFSSLFLSANALISTYKKDSDCYLTKPLLETLSPHEEVAVVAHEIGHAAAKHSLKKQIVSLPMMPVTLAANATYLLTAGFALAGWAACGATLGAAYAGATLLNKTDLSKTTKEIIMYGGATGTMLTIPVLLGRPDISLLWLTATASNLSCGLLSAAYSRACEFQADRLSAQSTGHPVALATGLIKIGHKNKKSFGENEDRLKRLFADPFRTHPRTARRVVALMAMEQAAPSRVRTHQPH